MVILIAQSSFAFRIATTTSVENSGLFNILLPAFEKKEGVHVQVIAVGTGRAIAIAKNGDVDALLIHAKEEEEKLIAEKVCLNRIPFMTNYFTLVGPKEDPANIKGKNVLTALSHIFRSKSRFFSRGDQSGTHLRELTFWRMLALNPRKYPGYFETGQSMGATLMIAYERQGYVLADWGTVLAFTSKIDLVPFSKEEKNLKNEYSFLPLNPQKFPRIDHQAASKFAQFLGEEKTRNLIANFKVGGRQG
jgi:tungstate transport system substrate-binding protein